MPEKAPNYVVTIKNQDTGEIYDYDVMFLVAARVSNSDQKSLDVETISVRSFGKDRSVVQPKVFSEFLKALSKHAQDALLSGVDVLTRNANREAKSHGDK